MERKGVKFEKMETPAFGCLQGVKVVYQGGSLAGARGVASLSENGAEVVHIESPTSKDVLHDTAQGYLMALEQRNVWQIALDYRKGKGNDIFFKLLKEGQVLVEVYKGGTYAKLGLTDEVLWEINPKLVIVHVSGFGQYGDPKFYPRASYDFVAQSFSGLVWNNSNEQGGSDFAKPAVADYFTGMDIALNAMMALYRATITGKGESVDVTQYEIAMRNSHWQIARGLTHKEQPKSFSGCDCNIAANANYTCKDGKKVCIFTAGGPMIKRATQLFGLEGDPDFEGKPMVFWYDPYCDKFIKAIEKFCAERTAQEVDDACLEYGIPCVEVMKYEDMLTHPHMLARGDIVTTYSEAKDMDITCPAPSGKFKNNPNQIWRGYVEHGYDNEAVLRSYGYSDEEIKEMYDEGVITQLGPDSRA